MLCRRQRPAVTELCLVMVSLSLRPEPVPVFAQVPSAAEVRTLKDDVERIKGKVRSVYRGFPIDESHPRTR
jgi:hypothetical protein